MKFISKNSNYRLVIQPGQPGNRSLGIQAVPGIYVTFIDGEAEVRDETLIKRVMNTLAYENGDVIKTEVDPFFSTRKEIEPSHNITDMKNGNFSKALNPKPVIQISEDQKIFIKKTAQEMALRMYEELKNKEMVKQEEPIENVVPENVVPEPIEQAIDSANIVLKDDEKLVKNPMVKKKENYGIDGNILVNDKEEVKEEVVKEEVEVVAEVKEEEVKEEVKEEDATNNVEDILSKINNSKNLAKKNLKNKKVNK